MMDRLGEGVQITFEGSARLTSKQPFYRLVDDTEWLLIMPSAAPELE